MNDHNQRAEKLWETIEGQAEWEGARVVDLGCGHGDMLWRACKAGAGMVLGIDQDIDALHGCLNRKRHYGVEFGILGFRLEYWLRNDLDMKQFDIAICFSVLPYLNMDYQETLRAVSKITSTLFLEVQYWGDGPAKPTFIDDGDARTMLNRFFPEVEAIGGTVVKHGAHTRTVWKCSR